MEIAFWRSLFNAAPKAVRAYLEEIQLAMDIGRIITTFFDASSPPHPAHIGIVNDSMTWYRVPTDLTVLVSAVPLQLLTSFVQSLDNDQNPLRVPQSLST
jgi:hypothetical protein